MDCRTRSRTNRTLRVCNARVHPSLSVPGRFIVGSSLLLGVPLTWLLSRARPIEPLPVALLGGLGAAALGAFTLQFFHPFAVTFIDLSFHLVAIAIVVGLAAMLNQRTLSPA
jgi:apolipoprotein N-acyltransferase